MYTDDPDYLESIRVLRDVLTKGGVEVKSHRSLPVGSNSIAAWVNGDTFDNEEKAMKDGPLFEKVSKLTTQLDLNHDICFSDVIPSGGGVDISTRSVAVYIFSIYNASRRDVEKKTMDKADVSDVALAYGIPDDDTVLILFKKGEFSQSMTDEFIANKLLEAKASPIIEKSKFQRIHG